MSQPDKVLTITQAADYAGVSRRTIYNWIIFAKLPTYKTPSGKLRIRVSDLIQPTRATEQAQSE